MVISFHLCKRYLIKPLLRLMDKTFKTVTGWILLCYAFVEKAVIYFFNKLETISTWMFNKLAAVVIRITSWITQLWIYIRKIISFMTYYLTIVWNSFVSIYKKFLRILSIIIDKVIVWATIIFNKIVKISHFLIRKSSQFLDYIVRSCQKMIIIAKSILRPLYEMIVRFLSFIQIKLVLFIEKMTKLFSFLKDYLIYAVRATKEFFVQAFKVVRDCCIIIVASPFLLYKKITKEKT